MRPPSSLTLAFFLPPTRAARWKTAVVLLLAATGAVASCGGDDPADASTPPGTGGTAATVDPTRGGASGTGGAAGFNITPEEEDAAYLRPQAPEIQALPALVSGSRLRAKYIALDDGTKLLQAWHDTQLNVDCTFRQVSATRWQCFPDEGWGQDGLYLESTCQTHIAGATQGTVAPLFVFVKAKKDGSCASDLAVNVFAPVPIDPPAIVYESSKLSGGSSGTSSCYSQDTLGNLTSQPVPLAAGPFVQAGDPVPATTFVTAVAQPSITSDGFAFLTLRAEDGATFWVPTLADACAPKPDLIGPTQVVGAGRIRAEFSVKSFNDYQLGAASQLVKNAPAFRDTATNQPCSLVEIAPLTYICTVARERCAYDPSDSFNPYLDNQCTTRLVNAFFANINSGGSLEAAQVNDFCWEGTTRLRRIVQKFIGNTAGPIFDIGPRGACRVDPFVNSSDIYFQMGEEVPFSAFPALTAGQE